MSNIWLPAPTSGDSELPVTPVLWEQTLFLNYTGTSTHVHTCLYMEHNLRMKGKIPKTSHHLLLDPPHQTSVQTSILQNTLAGRQHWLPEFPMPNTNNSTRHQVRAKITSAPLIKITCDRYLYLHTNNNIYNIYIIMYPNLCTTRIQ